MAELVAATDSNRGDWFCANDHRCAPDEGVCMLCGAGPKFQLLPLPPKHQWQNVLKNIVDMQGLDAVLRQLGGEFHHDGKWDSGEHAEMWLMPPSPTFDGNS